MKIEGSDSSEGGVALEEALQLADTWRLKADEYLRVLQATGIFERSYVLSHATMQQRQRYHELAKFCKADVIEARKRLAGRYFDEVEQDLATVDFVLDRSAGVGSLDLSSHPLVRAAVEESLAFHAGEIAKGRNFPSKGSIAFVGSAKKDFDANSSLFRLAQSPLLIGPIARYFGMFPILTGFGVTFAPNTDFHRKSSQRLHFDPEDRTQIKVFVYLTDVDADSGPFMAATADASSVLFDRPGFILDRQDDTVVPEASIRSFEGRAGQVIFCDTCRCLHAGARPGKRSRLMLSIEYNIPTHLGVRLFPTDNEPSRSRIDAIEPSVPDEFVDALLGRTLLAAGI